VSAFQWRRRPLKRLAATLGDTWWARSPLATRRRRKGACVRQALRPSPSLWDSLGALERAGRALAALAQIRRPLRRRARKRLGRLASGRISGRRRAALLTVSVLGSQDGRGVWRIRRIESTSREPPPPTALYPSELEREPSQFQVCPLRLAIEKKVVALSRPPPPPTPPPPVTLRARYATHARTSALTADLLTHSHTHKFAPKDTFANHHLLKKEIRIAQDYSLPVFAAEHDDDDGVC
jgi:hypothetical protein